MWLFVKSCYDFRFVCVRVCVFDDLVCRVKNFLLSLGCKCVELHMTAQLFC